MTTNQPFQQQPYQPVPSKIATRAASTASLIGVLKWILLVVNAIGSVIYIAVGINASKPDTSTVVEGEFATNDSGNPFGMVFVAAGVGSLVVGTIVILVLFGWFQHMLATNAELVRQGSRNHTGGQA